MDFYLYAADKLKYKVEIPELIDKDGHTMKQKMKAGAL